MTCNRVGRNQHSPHLATASQCREASKFCQPHPVAGEVGGRPQIVAVEGADEHSACKGGQRGVQSADHACSDAEALTRKQERRRACVVLPAACATSAGQETFAAISTSAGHQEERTIEPSIPRRVYATIRNVFAAKLCACREREHRLDRQVSLRYLWRWTAAPCFPVVGGKWRKGRRRSSAQLMKTM